MKLWTLYPFALLAKVSKSLIRRFLNRSSLCPTASESHRALFLSHLRWSLLSLSSTANSEISGEETRWSFIKFIHVLWTTKARLTPKQSGSTRFSGQYINLQSTSLSILEALHTSCDQAWRVGDSCTIMIIIITNNLPLVPSMWGSFRLTPIIFFTWIFYFVLWGGIFPNKLNVTQGFADCVYQTLFSPP